MGNSVLKLDLQPAVLLAEQARLVARGVRVCALVGHCVADHLALTRAMTVLGTANCPGALPFTADRGDGMADCGFAAAKWAIDLYRYAIREAPDRQRHRIVGLLLGYSAQAIHDFEDLNDAMTIEPNGSGASPAPISSPRPRGSRYKAGNARPY